MASEESDKLTREFIYAQQHHLLDGEAGRAVTEVFQHGIVDDFIASEIERRVRKHRLAREFSHALHGPFDLPKLKHGDWIIGFDMRGSLIRAPSQIANDHSITMSGSGGGKTTKTRFWSLQVAKKVKVWWFDFVKREFIVLKPYLKRLGITLLVPPTRKLRLNPLQVPYACRPEGWAPVASEMLVNVLKLSAGPRATKLLHKTILNLYKRFNIFNGSEHYPVLHDLREAIAADSEANPQAKQLIIDSLDPILLSIGPVLAWRVGWGRGLAKLHISFQLDDIAEAEKDLVLNTLVVPEVSSRIAQGQSNVPMDLIIYLDEASRLVSASSGSTAIVDLIGAVRGAGLGLDLSVLSGDVSRAILSSTANKFVGRAGSAQDLDVICSAMGLRYEHRRWLSTHLVPGLFLGQLGEGWREPFLFRIPPMTLESHADIGVDKDGDVEGLVKLPSVAATEYANWDPDRTQKIAQISTGAETDSCPLSEVELRFLGVVVDHPGRRSSDLPRLANMSPKRALKIRRRLIELGYIRERRVNTGKRGRAAIILEPLELLFNLNPSNLL